jgi:hypothetical protein
MTTSSRCSGCRRRKPARSRRGRAISRPIGPEVDDAVAAIRAATAEARVSITLHDIEIARAAEMANALDVMVEEMQANGQLKAFNTMFKARRSAAAASGHGFNVLSRCRAALAQGVDTSARIIGRQCAASCSSIRTRERLRVLIDVSFLISGGPTLWGIFREAESAVFFGAVANFLVFFGGSGRIASRPR